MSCQKLTVGEKECVGHQVWEGFYDSMPSLRKCDSIELSKYPKYFQQFSNYKNKLKLSRNNNTIPSISLEQSDNLIFTIKKNVSDLYCITALHYTRYIDMLIQRKPGVHSTPYNNEQT